MERPPEYELYDLKNDPWEFENLAADPKHSQILETLCGKLKGWRIETNDPLLNPVNQARLKAEIESCFIDGTPVKNELKLNYPDYFFDE